MTRIIGAKNIPDDGEISWHCHRNILREAPGFRHGEE
jgi:hypothetical protein